MGVAAEALECRDITCDAAFMRDADGGLGKDRQLGKVNPLHAALWIGGTLAFFCRAEIHDARKPVAVAQ